MPQDQHDKTGGCQEAKLLLFPILLADPRQGQARSGYEEGGFCLLAILRCSTAGPVAGLGIAVEATAWTGKKKVWRHTQVELWGRQRGRHESELEGLEQIGNGSLELSDGRELV